MLSTKFHCWFLLITTATCLVNSQQETSYIHDVLYDPSPLILSRQRRDSSKPPTTVQVGDITVQTGKDWSVNVFDFVKVKKKPDGGVDVQVLQPGSIFARMFPPSGAGAPPGENTNGQQRDNRRSQPRLES